VFEVAHSLLEFFEFSESAEGSLEDGLVAAEVDMLIEDAKAQALHALDRTFIWYFGLGNESKYCGLAGTVRTDQADVFAGVDLKTNGAQDLLRAVGFENLTKSKKHLRIVTRHR
jgi:hypothetical protein